MSDLAISGTGTLVVVEGTKQHLAAVSAAKALEDVGVVGIAGCYGWMSDGRPIDDLSAIRWDRPVVVCFDADIAINISVHEAAKRFADELTARGATSVKFVRLPDGGTTGLDDALATRVGPGGTSPVLNGLIKGATKLPSAPRGAGARFFGPDGLLVAQLIDELRKVLHLAVDAGNRLLVYDAGVYVDGRHHVTAQIGDLLGDLYRQMYERSAIELLTAQFAVENKVIDANATAVIINVANGLLDPFTRQLDEHSPEHLSAVQLPVIWDPSATCPTFDAWLDEVTDGRGDDLLEACL